MANFLTNGASATERTPGFSEEPTADQPRLRKSDTRVSGFTFLSFRFSDFPISGTGQRDRHNGYGRGRSKHVLLRGKFVKKEIRSHAEEPIEEIVEKKPKFKGAVKKKHTFEGAVKKKQQFRKSREEEQPFSTAPTFSEFV